MTYDAREQSTHGGAPVECYRFAMGDRLWLLTSADRTVVLPSGTYMPAVISRGELDHSQEDGAGTLQVKVPRSSALAGLYVAGLPSRLLSLVLYRAHRGDEANAVVAFTGTVAALTVEGPEATLTCAPVSAAFRRRLPGLQFQSQCNWPLYSLGCGLSAADYRDTVTVSTVSGVTVTAAGFAARASGWFRNGWLEGPDGEKRFIVDHVGNAVTLMTPPASLAAGQTAYAYAGCDRTESACASKFNNLANHLGWARIPARNPHDGSIV